MKEKIRYEPNRFSFWKNLHDWHNSGHKFYLEGVVSSYDEKLESHLDKDRPLGILHFEFTSTEDHYDSVTMLEHLNDEFGDTWKGNAKNALLAKTIEAIKRFNQ